MTIREVLEDMYRVCVGLGELESLKGRGKHFARERIFLRAYIRDVFVSDSKAFYNSSGVFVPSKLLETVMENFEYNEDLQNTYKVHGEKAVRSAIKSAQLKGMVPKK